MDPNANLQEQERLVRDMKDKVPSTSDSTLRQNRARLKELRVALVDWLKGGGFQPDWTQAPKASRYFESWRKFGAQARQQKASVKLS